MVKLGRRVLATSAAAVLATGVAVGLTPGVANAHGAMMKPGSRTYLCYLDGKSATGGMQPKNPACAAAVAKSGANSLYNWFAVLRSDAGGRTTGYIPDGQLCSGGTGGPYDFTGYNLARNDWPVTHLTAGATMEVDYSNWAAHPGTFNLYVTKDGYDPTKPLAWGDLESKPFDTVTNPPASGGPGSDAGHYYWNAKLPAGKTGRHIIYSHWIRSDSKENFYGCSDVVFDGGNGKVTGVGSSQDDGTAGENSSSANSSGGQGDNGGAAACTATYKISSSWQGGYQADVTVTNGGTAAVGAWAVSWTLPDGQDVVQAWSGTLVKAGSLVTVKNAAWNGSLSPGASATFGLVGSGAGAVPAMSCSTT